MNQYLTSTYAKSVFFCVQLGFSEGLPTGVEQLNEETILGDEQLAKKLHSVLLEVEVLEGELVCPETGRKFPISNGIPNMLVNEDEI